jgi:adenosylcobinamide-GDP ribazoletransferase
MHILKSLVIAFSIYSKIPVPQFEWKDEDMKYMLCFFPWIGAVIGVCVYLWYYAYTICNIGQVCYTLIGVAIPLVITGGFHVDGFMDTMDAFHSYQPKEKKLEILKDSHIGAFSVIMLALYGLIYIGAFSEIIADIPLKIVCAGFVLSRCLSGLAIVYFPLAKKDGMLYTFATGSQKNILKWSLILQCIICSCFMLYQSIFMGAFSILASFISFAYYYYRTKKELGGINGDTAGYFVLICEESIVVVTAICGLWRF